MLGKCMCVCGGEYVLDICTHVWAYRGQRVSCSTPLYFITLRQVFSLSSGSLVQQVFLPTKLSPQSQDLNERKMLTSNEHHSSLMALDKLPKLSGPQSLNHLKWVAVLLERKKLVSFWCSGPLFSTSLGKNTICEAVNVCIVFVRCVLYNCN